VVSLHNKDRPLLDDNALCCADTDNISSLIDAQTDDTYCKSILEKIKTKSNTVKSSLFSLNEGVLHFQNRIIVPSTLRARILKSFHYSPTNGHQGIDKTLEKIKRYYWWPNMKKDIHNYVLSCSTCARCKIRRHKP